MWWLINLFCKCHFKNHDNVTSLLLLDNCTDHHIYMSNIPPNLIIDFLPPNVTSKHQASDMEMVEATNIGYKS